MIRNLLVLGATLLLAISIVRNAAVAMLGEREPERAARYWAAHPAVQASGGMTQIARAARTGTAVPERAFALLKAAAAREPLALEPFLVRGVQAQLANDHVAATRAFEAAQWRNPHSVQASYFLSDQYLRVGDVEHGLREIATLARVAPNGAAAISPYVAAYAANPASWASLRKLFRTNRELAAASLTTLASNAKTAPAVLALADPREPLRDAPWLPSLLNTLIVAGDYTEARAVWLKASGTGGGELIHDTEFSDKQSLAPFNWALTSSAVGLAERQPDGRLHLIFYGQEDGILAAQLLLLKPGPYRLSMQLIGDASRVKALNWSIWCDESAEPISSVTLDKAVDGWTFDIPAACPAQWLKLSGSSGEQPLQMDAVIAGLKLERLPPGA